MANKKTIEILAPAGGLEALAAGVYCGADAVYLGGKGFNARRTAANFSDKELLDAVSFCHTRGVKVYQAINTIVFPSELRELEEALLTACSCGVDGIIIQDLAVLETARKCSPSLPLHASTQMSVHNLDGVKALEQLGFSRVVLARELSRNEIEFIASRTPLDIECFVHGALCVCVSGQCYLSSMIGGRSGNRGLCAQPCRLPFASPGNAHALSLKDLSLVKQISDIASIGVKSLKIEGRLKRPEYVAAAVTACGQAARGETPDLRGLRAVFSRSGFTGGYYAGDLNDGMFGVRAKEDSASPALLKELSGLYARERQRIPVDMRAAIKRGAEMRLDVADDDGNTASAAGPPPEIAEGAPTTPEKVCSFLAKTGGTPYSARAIECVIDGGLMAPSSSINALRREALDKLSRVRGGIRPRDFTPYNFASICNPKASRPKRETPLIRVRLQNPGQLSMPLAKAADAVIVPIAELHKLRGEAAAKYRGKIYAELPRVSFGNGEDLELGLHRALELGISHVSAGNLGGVERAARFGFSVHGDFGLNAANSLALEVLAEMGLADLTLSFELGLRHALSISGSIPRGIVAYGYLPLMIMRNYPAGTRRADSASLTDRLGNKFRLECLNGVTELYNMAPLVLSDKMDRLAGFDFITLYFTSESAVECLRVFSLYKNGGVWDGPKTNGLYFRKVR